MAFVFHDSMNTIALLIDWISDTLLVSRKLSNNLDGFNVKITIADKIARIAITIISSTNVNDFFIRKINYLNIPNTFLTCLILGWVIDKE